MQYRQFFHNGKPTDRIDSSEGAFGTRDEVGIAEVAERLGVPASEVTAVVTTERPAAVSVVIPPTPDEFVPPPLERLLVAIAEAKSLDELKRAAANIR